ncbi:MAG: hypothetical protein ACYS22_07755, partial [Planctomycetota bacterium]
MSGAIGSGGAADNLLNQLQSVEGSWPSWLSFLDGAGDVEKVADEVASDGRVSGEDVIRVIREAKDFGGITSGERAALIDLVENAGELFDGPALTALAAFLRIPVPTFERPVPPSSPDPAEPSIPTPEPIVTPEPLTPSEPAVPAGEVFPAASAEGTQTAETRRLLAAWANVPGETSVTTMAANGNRPVAVHVPPGFDPSKPAKVVTYMHGHRWNVGSKLAQHGVLDKLAQLQQSDPQTIFVAPQAGSPPFSTWMSPPESFAGLQDAALGEAARLAGAGSISVETRIVDAHSGAGLGLKNAVRAGTFAADKINLHDAAYGNWAQTVTRWAMEQPEGRKPRIDSYYTNHSTQPRNNREIARLAPDLVT